MAAIESSEWFSHYVRYVSAVTHAYRMYNKTDHRTRSPSDPATVARYAYELGRSTGDTQLRAAMSCLTLFGIPEDDDKILPYYKVSSQIIYATDECLIVNLSKLFDVVEQESIYGLVSLIFESRHVFERIFADSGNMRTKYVSDERPEGVTGDFRSLSQMLFEYAAVRE